MNRTRFQVFPTYTQEFHTHHSYPVCFTNNLFTGTNQTIRRTLTKMGHDAPLRCAILVDSGVVARNRNLVKQIIRHFQKEHPFFELCHAPFIMCGGESVKNSQRMVEETATIAHAHGLTQESLVFVVGGGAFLDAAGTALAQCRGGIKTINVPTSTLSQCAAGIGTMRYMNTRGIKNFSGITAPPYAVFIDFSLLRTLPFEHHISGMAEAFKMALSADTEFFLFLVKKARKLRQNDLETVEKVVHKTATLHLDRARASSEPTLDEGSSLGCRVAHWLETRSGYKLPHGHALSVGIALNASYARHTGSLSEADFSRLVNGLVTSGLPVWNRFLETRSEKGSLEVTAMLARSLQSTSEPLMVPDGLGALKAVSHLDFKAFEKGIGVLRGHCRKEFSGDRRLFVVTPWNKTVQSDLSGQGAHADQ